MKIILSNYRYFVSGGPERYLFSIQDMLKAHGHAVFPFSVRSDRNVPCEHEDRFLSPIADEDSVYFNEYKKTSKTILKILARQFYCPEAFFKARSFAKFSGADLVYSLQFLNKMSPAVLDGFKSAGFPVVLRLSDFGLICPQAHLFDGTTVCEKCLGGNFLHAFTKRCIMSSRMAGLIKALALTLQRLLRCKDRIDAYVFPSRFTMEKFVEAGFPPGKMYHLNTFIDSGQIVPDYSEGGNILYFGRFVPEKGLHRLLEAYRNIPGDKPKLIAIGNLARTKYSSALIQAYKNEVEFQDFMSKDKLAEYMKHTMCVVIPSVWYDNLPNVLLESYAYGKPVIVPRHGCFVDLVRDGETGLLYEADNAGDLREKLAWAMAHPSDMARMGKAARNHVEGELSPGHHYDRLMSIFENII